MDEQLRLERQWHAFATDVTPLRGRKLLTVAIAVFTVTAFMPYPGLAIGSNTGLEAYHFLAAAALPAILLVGLPPRHVAAALLYLIPFATSAGVAAVMGSADSLRITVNVLLSSTLGCVSMLPAGWIAKAKNLPFILTGVCVAICVHAAAGAYQVYAFAHGTFPFLNILQNPSYEALAPVAEEWVLYVQRPFGLFPEPSAMGASLGPWLIVTTGLLLYPQVAPFRIGPRLRLLLLVATIAGVWLIIWARSGSVAPLIALIGAVGLPRLRQAASQFLILRRLGFLFLSIAVLWVIVIAARTQFDQRLETARGANPWEDRQTSIQLGVGVPTSGVEQVFFGVGPGQSTLIMQKTQSLDTIWSISVRIFADTGLLGLFALITIGVMVAAAIFRSSARFIGACAALGWLFGVTFITSYLMVSIWFFLAMLLNWDLLFPSERQAMWSLDRLRRLHPAHAEEK